MHRITAGGHELGRVKIGDLVAGCASLAVLLEVSAYPKPGNVHRTRDVPGTRYEHFLAGSVAITPAMRRLAQRGYDVKRASKSLNSIRVGAQVLDATKEVLGWQRGGNVNVGTVLLLAPLAAAAGSTLFENERIGTHRLRGALRDVVRSTIPDDAVAICRALALAVPPRVLGKVDEFDVLDESTIKRIRREGLTPLDLFQRCAPRDSICREWVSGFETVFVDGHPYLRAAVEASGDVNSAIVNTFLQLLAKRADSLIQRKAGLERALEVSEKAGRVLSEGGASSEGGKKLLWDFDEELYRAGGMLNPGTTADLTAASIFVLLLEGWRP